LTANQLNFVTGLRTALDALNPRPFLGVAIVSPLQSGAASPVLVSGSPPSDVLGAVGTGWSVGTARQLLQQLTELRRIYPILRRSRFLTGEYNKELGLKDVTWINASGAEMEDETWADDNMRCFGMLIDGRAQPTRLRKRGEDATLLLVMNGHHDLVEFTLPEVTGGGEWSLKMDTNLPILPDDNALFATGNVYGVTGRSVLVFKLAADKNT